MVFCCIGVSRKFSFKARLEAASPISGAPVEMSAVLWINRSKRLPARMKSVKSSREPIREETLDAYCEKTNDA